MFNFALLCLLFIHHAIRDWLRHGYRKPIFRGVPVLQGKTSPDIP
jgi:hypothetical protein